MLIDIVFLRPVLLESSARSWPPCQWFPSISALIADPPQKQLWQFAMSMMMLQRVLDGLIIHGVFHDPSSHTRGGHCLNWFTLLTHWAEYGFLALLSFVTSNDSLWYHQLGFIGFCCCAWTHMMLLLTLQWRQTPVIERRFVWTTLSCPCVSLQWRARAAVANVACVVTAAYFYLHHERTCAPGAYSKFAVAEWLVVLSNISFHSALLHDVGDRRLELGLPNGNVKAQDSDHDRHIDHLNLLLPVREDGSGGGPGR
jgi:hypothetical protein